jgi:type I restriction enzyme S subunit
MKAKKYLKYKHSGVEWLGEMPEHWGIKKLKYCCQLITTKTAKREYPVALENIESWTGRFLETESEFEGEGIGFKQNDILFGKLRPYLAKVFQADRNGEAVGDFFVLRPLKNVVAANQSYILRSREYIEIIDGSTFGAKMPRASWDFMGSLLVPLAPPAEQQSIASFLDRETGRIDSLIVKNNRLIDLLKEKRTATISRAVTKGLDLKVKMKPSGVEWLGEVPAHWVALPLRRIVKSVKTGGTPAGVEESAFDNDGFNWYSPVDFSESIILGESTRKLSEEGKKEVRIFPEMTVMLIGIGATIGKVGLSTNEASCNQQINGIVCGNKLNPLFATYYLKTMRDFIVKCGKYTTLPIINQEETKNLTFTLPPLAEQQSICLFLDSATAKIDKLINKVETAILTLKEYRTALISAAVTGKIDVREAA